MLHDVVVRIRFHPVEHSSFRHEHVTGREHILGGNADHAVRVRIEQVKGRQDTERCIQRVKMGLVELPGNEQPVLDERIVDGT